MHIKFFVSLLFFSLAGQSQPLPLEGRFPLVDRYLDSMMKEWNVPGLALGIVSGDRLVYARGYGYRDGDKKLPVDPSTIFPIASNTKLFTATLAAMLDGEGKIQLDQPVRTYLPALQFSSEELNARVTLRDMLSHRTGLPRYDGLWVGAPFSRKEVVKAVPYMRAQLGLREGYLYNNMMYAAAGAVLETTTDSSWESLVRSRIFLPLQMKTSCFTDSEARRQGNYAIAYRDPDSMGQRRPVRFVAQSPALGPAGTIKSSVEDLSHWMIAQLNDGMYAGKKVLPTAAIRQTMIPQIIADKEARWEEVSHALYAMGRSIQMYKGFRLASHTGSIDGFYSSLTLLPAQKLGIFVVYNSGTMGSFRGAIAYSLIDRLLGLEPTDWSGRFRKEYLEGLQREKRAKDSLEATRVKNTSPSHALADYAGSYTHPAYGEMKISVRDHQLFLAFRGQEALLHHFHYDQFITREEENGFPDFRLQFFMNTKGDIYRLISSPYGDPPAEFTRKTVPLK